MVMVVVVGYAVDATFPLALHVALRLQSAPQKVVRGLEFNRGAAELVNIGIDRREGPERNPLEFSLRDHTIQVQVAVGDPLSQTAYASLIAHRKAIEEHVISVQGDRGRAHTTRSDRHTRDAIELTGVEHSRSSDSEGERDRLRLVTVAPTHGLPSGLPIRSLHQSLGRAGEAALFRDRTLDQVGQIFVDDPLEVLFGYGAVTLSVVCAGRKLKAHVPSPLVQARELPELRAALGNLLQVEDKCLMGLFCP